MKAIGLEVSTSSAKSIIFCPKNGVIAEATLPFPKDIADGPALEKHKNAHPGDNLSLIHI